MLEPPHPHWLALRVQIAGPWPALATALVALWVGPLVVVLMPRELDWLKALYQLKAPELEAAEQQQALGQTSPERPQWGLRGLSPALVKAALAAR